MEAAVVGSETVDTPAKHTLYIIRLTPADGSEPRFVARRYSQFFDLFTAIKSSHPTAMPNMAFPAKNFWSKFAPAVVKARETELSAWIAEVVASAPLADSPALVAFLQPTAADAVRSAGNQPVLLRSPGGAPPGSGSSTRKPVNPLTGTLKRRSSLILKASASGFSQDQADDSLFAAAAEGNLTNVQAALSKGANVNARDEDGWSPLWAPARDGKTEVVNALIAAGVDVNAVDVEREPVLFVVLSDERLPILKALLDAGADPNMTSQGLTPLHYAAWQGQPAAAKLLIERGALVSTLSSTGFTPLYMAINFCNDDPETVKAILAGGADRTKPVDGFTPLELAKRLDLPKIISLLQS